MLKRAWEKFIIPSSSLGMFWIKFYVFFGQISEYEEWLPSTDCQLTVCHLPERSSTDYWQVTDRLETGGKKKRGQFSIEFFEDLADLACRMGVTFCIFQASGGKHWAVSALALCLPLLAWKMQKNNACPVAVYWLQLTIFSWQVNH